MPNHRYFDEGFRREVQWDVPLTEGYEFQVLGDISLEREMNACDVLWVHGWQSTHLRRAIRIAKSLGKPVLMRGENCDMAMPDGAGLKGWLKRRYLARIFTGCTAFLAIGTLNHQYYLSRGASPTRIFQMPYAIDNETFANAAAEAQTEPHPLKERLGIPAETPIILYAGKLSARKHPELLAHAIQMLDDVSPAPALVYVGDGEMMDELRTLAPAAHFIGFVNQSALPAYYAMADVFVLPSEREPWGLAVNEAMACATPVVVSDQVGAATDLVDGETGIVFESGNPIALADAIRIALKNPAEMGACAQRKVTGWGFDADIAGLRQALESVRPQL